MVSYVIRCGLVLTLVTSVPTIVRAQEGDGLRARGGPMLSVGADRVDWESANARPALALDEHGITLGAPDDSVSLRIGGRFHVDGGGQSIVIDRMSFGSGERMEIRRSWIESYLSIKDGYEIGFQYDPSNKAVPIFDAVIAYRGMEPFIFTIGNMREPFLLDRLTDNNITLFNELALTQAFVADRNFGGAVGASGGNWSVTSGIYGQNANLGIADGGWSVVTRATYAPILEPGHVLHLAVAGSARFFDPRSPDFAQSTIPEDFVFPASLQLIDTGVVDRTSRVNRLGLEGVYQLGPVTIQSEYVRVGVDRSDARPSLLFQGGYVQLGWILNGQPREYRLKPAYGTAYGVFGGVQVPDGKRLSQGGYGIFELGARWSAIDLRDKDVNGGVERDVTLGLNWYPEPNMRIVNNYVHVSSSASGLAGAKRVEADAFVSRLQLYW